MIDDYEENVRKFWAALITFIFIFPVAVIYSGFVLVYLWGLFIVPITSLNPITIVQAIGLDLFITLLLASNYCEDKRKQGERIAMLFIKPTMFLFMGYIVSLFL